MKAIERHRQNWQGKSDEWLFERLDNELKQKVEEIHRLLAENETLRQFDVSTSLYGLYSIDNELMFVHKTREGAKKHQYEFEKEHGMGFYVDPVIVLE